MTVTRQHGRRIQIIRSRDSLRRNKKEPASTAGSSVLKYVF
jgi:hypothetical protein